METCFQRSPFIYSFLLFKSGHTVERQRCCRIEESAGEHRKQSASAMSARGLTHIVYLRVSYVACKSLACYDR